MWERHKKVLQGQAVGFRAYSVFKINMDRFQIGFVGIRRLGLNGSQEKVS